MQSLPPSWYQAVFLRHSRRSFMSRRPEEEKVARLEALCREFRPYPGVRAEFVRQSPDTDGPKDSGRYPKRLDCGIAMLHLELGAAAAGVSGRWVPPRPPEVARFEAQK